MNKFILILLLTSASICVYGQTSNNLTLGSLYSNLSGLNAELSYSKQFTNRVGIIGRLAYNFNESYGVRGGLFYRFISIEFLNIDFGAEYNYDRHKNSNINDEIISSNLEFPLTISYMVSKSFELYGGISSNINLNDSEPNRLADNLRLGVTYKW